VTVPPRNGPLFNGPLFSVCTLVSDPAQHGSMRTSFTAGGFTDDRTEYLTLDNSGGNIWCAYSGITRLLEAARGRYAIFCHQDVRLLSDGLAVLAARLADLDRRAPDWALAGNAGMRADGRPALRITDPHGADQRSGPFPARVVSLDENFLVVRGDAGIRPSARLSGFHLYGTDLCLQARAAGRSAWVVDFHLRHLSAGRVDAGFLAQQEEFERQWGARLGRSERIRTTCTTVTLRAGLASSLLGRWRLARRRARLGL
jgi:hypothetical protein